MGITRAVFQDKGPIDFLLDLHARGIRITPEGDRLHVQAPEGVLTEELKWKIRARKAELLRIQEYKVMQLQVPSQNEPGHFDLWVVAEAADGWFSFWYSGSTYQAETEVKI